MNENPTLLLGAHMSIAGGVHKAIGRGEALGCTAIQVFTKNATRWKVEPLSREEVAQFGAERLRTGVLAAAHDSYLINIASPDSALWKKSLAALIEEVERAEQLQIPFLIMHPGSHTGAGVDNGLRSISRALNQLLQETAGFGVKIVLENTAGQGTALGSSFQHLARIVGESIQPARLGVCLDTCHAFAAGYDLSHKAGYDQVLDELDQILGLSMLMALHLNDSKKGLGSRVDRHEHIGRGMIGLECFLLIMNDPRFEDIPKLIETPNELGGVEMDPVNLHLLKEMVGQSGRG